MKIYLECPKKLRDIETHPCHRCEVGHSSYAKCKDEDGEYIEITSCQDTCYKYQDYIEKIFRVRNIYDKTMDKQI